MTHPRDPLGVTDNRAAARPIQLETHGLDVIGDADRRGTPRMLFWPWFGANVSVLGLSYGAFAFGFGIDRTFMFRHDLNDLRPLFEGDVRFSAAFGTEI